MPRSRRGLGFDVINDGVNTYLYNADGQVCAVESYDATLHMTIMTGYIYDADGQRVAKGTITTMSCDPTVNGFTTQSDYVRDQSGNQLSEFTVVNGSPQWIHTNVYASGELMATDDTNETHFYLNDWLGTRRVMTGPSGVVEQDCMSLPYGDSETCIPLPAENLYTGKEKDEETQGGVSPFGVNQGNDYFGARYYGSVTGRWLSPDPSGLFYSNPSDPQSLNLYAYVGNHPFSYIDPYGLNWFNQAPCGGAHYSEMSLGIAIKSFFANLFTDCGGEGTGGDDDPDDGFDSPGGGFGGSNYQTLSQQEINSLVDTTRQYFSSACRSAFTGVGKATGTPFNLDSFTANLKSGPFDQHPELYDEADAETDPGPNGPHSTATIHLWHGFYSYGNSTRGFILFHEETHRYFGIGDYHYAGENNMNFDDLFGPFGYRRHREPDGSTGTSHQFTEWLEGGCK